MKRVIRVFSVFAAFLCLLFLSCSDDNSDYNFNAVYDLRPLTRVFEEFGSMTENRDLQMIHKKHPGHAFFRSEREMRPGFFAAFSQESSSIEEIYAFTYGNNAHLYWTAATGKDALGNTISTATQTLDDAGFPTRCFWYDAEENFKYAYDYTYDRSLYLRTSVICYMDNPTDNPDARRDYESSSVWNKDGILTTRMGVEYDSNGIIVNEYKWRSTTLKNSLRGAGGLGYDEYYKEYEEGLLKYQEETIFDSDGYPQTMGIDNNGDGTFEETYYAEIAKTVEGYLASVIWIEGGIGNAKWKVTFTYDEDGLLKTTRDYDWVEDKFVLNTIVTDVWYENPVNGPTGGIDVYFESDEEGNPVGEYKTVAWTVTQKTHHYFSSPGEELFKITESLEKIRLQ